MLCHPGGDWHPGRGDNPRYIQDILNVAVDVIFHGQAHIFDFRCQFCCKILGLSV